MGSEVITEAQKHLLAPKAERLLVWTTSLDTAVQDDDFLSDNASDLAALVLSTLPVYFDRDSQAAVRSFLVQAVKNDSCLKAVAGGIVKLGSSPLPGHECYVLTRWSCIVLGQLDYSTTKKACDKLIEVQASLLATIWKSGYKWDTVSRVIVATLHKKPELVDAYLKYAVSTVNPGLAKVLLDYGNANKDQRSNIESALLPAFVEKVLSAKEKSSAQDITAFQGLFANLQHTDYQQHIHPVLLKQLRRTPDVVLFVLQHMLQYINLDTSKYSLELLPLLVQQIRSKESVRASALSTVSLLAKHVSDADSLDGLVKSVTSVLNATGADKVKVPAERSALVNVLTNLCEVPGKGEAVGAAAKEVVDFILKFYKTEMSEEVKLALLQSLGCWLPRTSALPAPAVDALAAGLKDAKEVYKRAFLQTLFQTLKANAECRPALGSLSDQLAKQIEEGISKPIARTFGIYALACGVYLSAANAAGSTLATAIKAALKPDSVLISAVTASKLNTADTLVVLSLAEAVLLHLSDKLSADSLAAMCRLLVALVLHHNPEVKRAATAAASRVAGTAGMLQPLLEALHFWMSASATLPTVAETGTTGEDLATAVCSLGPRFASALWILLVPVAVSNLSQAEVCLLLLLGHHPTIVAGKIKPGLPLRNPLWRFIVNKHSGVKKALQEHAAAVSDFLAGPKGLESDCTPDAEAARFAIASLVHAAREQSFPHVMQVLGKLLDPSEHNQLTKVDVDIYETPEGTLSTERLSQGAFVPEVVEAKNVKKPRGRFKTDSSAFGGLDDDDDDVPVKKSVAPPSRTASANGTARGGRVGAAKGPAGRGTGRKDASQRQEEYRLQKLEEEAEVRAHVKAIKAKLELGLSCLEGVAQLPGGFMAKHLPELAPLCHPLLGSPVVDGAAFSAVKSLAACLPPALSLHSLALAASLRQVVMNSKGQYPALTSSRYAAEVIGALGKATNYRWALPPPAYRFVFPILQAILLSSSHSPLHEDALRVLALHVGPGLEIPRAESLKLMYHLLGVVPAYREKINPLLKSLCAGVTSEEELDAGLSGLLHPAANVRTAALTALPAVPQLANGTAPAGNSVSVVLFIACHDLDTDNEEAAKALWGQARCRLPGSALAAIVEQLGHPHPDVRTAVGQALASFMQMHTSRATGVLPALVALYSPEAPFSHRSGVATGLRCCAPKFGVSDVRLALDFLICNGLADHDSGIRAEMVAAGVALVDVHGVSLAQDMLPQFEAYLAGKGSNRSAEEDSKYDLVREGIVVFLGTLARHLGEFDPKRRDILDTLLEVLSTPSEAVQRAVSNCLPALMLPLSSDKPYVEEKVKYLLDRLTAGASFGDRKGAAFGLAGVVKGLGITALKTYGVMDSLKACIEDKKDTNKREGSLLAFECLCEKLGKLFEPYVIHILPMLLTCFGDSSVSVRQATEDAARAIMAQLTASGVKLVLPALLKSLDDKQWRTKQGSIQLLGAMAYCAPKQLGACLPQIVPRLGEVLSDPHAKVQAAAREALKEVGSVIRNPEIQALVSSLLSAISDPNKYTKPCLDTLLETVFVNTIDAPSLALIVPVIHRGLRDRTGDTKKRAARIVGNMCQLINDPKDMVPYVPMLMPELQKAVIDPLPEVRAVAARAMGSLMHGMGSNIFADLIPWLRDTLTSPASSVERSGAAQGLAEVLAVLGTGHLEALLPDLIRECRSPSAFTREGHLTLFRYLPLTLGEQFQPYLSHVLPVILDGLSDESEGVRDAALSAGRTFVDCYAQSSLPLLLPAVETGIFNDNWRIRQASVELMGELMFKVAGTSGKIVLDGDSDDEGAATEHYGKAIVEALGMDRRNEALAKLYMARTDVQYTVRNAALHVWKTVVVNTPKTLGEILPSLMEQVIDSLADEGEDQQQMAGRCLGELVRKMGDRVLHRILPILKEGMESEKASTRQGVCLGIHDVLENITRHQLLECLQDILPPVQTALCDPDPAVREAAGSAFSVLFKGGAGSAVETVVPTLLAGLETPAKYDHSLTGLRVILGVRPQTFNAMVPKLVKQPLYESHVKALGALADVAGPALNTHISTILPSLLSLASQSTHRLYEVAKESSASVALAVPEEGLHILVAEVLKALEDPSRRRGAADLLTTWCKNTKLDYEEHVSSLLTALISLLTEDVQEVLMACWQALGALAASIPKDMQASYVRVVKEAVGTAKEKERRKRRKGPLLVAGFCVPPKALSPVLPVYLQGVLQGSTPEVREMAAEGLGELVEVTSEDALKPFVVQITGPLIRIIGDRFPSPIKAAILTTLGLLITKAPLSLKPFVPQLQTTFVKCLLDQAQNVRQRAAENLGQLTRMSTRVEQLVAELLTSARTADPTMKEAFLLALKGAMQHSGDKISAATQEKIQDTLQDLVRTEGTGDDETLTIALASTLGMYCKLCSPDQLKSALAQGPLGPPATNPNLRHAHAITLAAVSQHALDKVQEAGLLKPVVDTVVKYAKDDKVPVRVAAGRAAARLLPVGGPSQSVVVGVLSALLGPDQSSEVQRQTMMSLRILATGHVALLEPHYSMLVPSLCSLLQDTSGPTKAACERTLVKIFGLDSSMEVLQKYLASSPGPLVKSTFTEPFIRRLQKRNDDDDYPDVEDY